MKTTWQPNRKLALFSHLVKALCLTLSVLSNATIHFVLLAASNQQISLILYDELAIDDNVDIKFNMDHNMVGI
jgi:hypothetical protein